MSSRTASRSASFSPASRRTRRRSASSKSSSPAIAASVTAATSGPQPAALGQEVDHLTLQEGRVRVHHDEVLRPSMQPGRLDRDVDLAPRRLRRPVAAASREVRPRHDELVAVHGIGGQPHDALDVPPAPAMPRSRSRGDGVDLGRQDRHQVRSSASPSTSASVSGSTATSTPAAARSRARPARDRRASAGASSDLHAEQEAPVDAHLLDVLDHDPSAARAANKRSAMPGPSWPLTVTRCGAATPRRGHDNVRSFSSTHPVPSTHRRTTRAGHPGHDAAVGDHRRARRRPRRRPRARRSAPPGG